jgi:hypothetical protein
VAPAQRPADDPGMQPIAPRPAHRGLVLGLAIAGGLCGLAVHPEAASARSEKTLAYPRDQVWSTAVRFLAVDEHAKITEKDTDAGYVTFELRDEGRPYRGSLEVVTVNRDGHGAVRFVLQIADRPSWMELAMLARLEDKLRAELGSPAPPPPPRKAEPGKDGKDDGSGAKNGDRREDGPPVSPTP